MGLLPIPLYICPVTVHIALGFFYMVKSLLFQYKRGVGPWWPALVEFFFMPLHLVLCLHE